MNKYILMKIERLMNGEIIISKEPGNSMEPILHSREPVILVPIQLLKEPIKKGDIVFSKIHGTCYTHKVYGVSEKDGFLIGNNSGYMNGWTREVYAKAFLIPRTEQGTNEELNNYLNKFIKDYEAEH